MLEFADACSSCYFTSKARSLEAKREDCMKWFAMWLEYNALIGNLGVVIWDIDGTLVDETTQAVIPQSAIVYDLSSRLGFKNVILTARPASKRNRELTQKMLKDNDFVYKRLLMMPPDAPCDEVGVSLFKAHERAKIGRTETIVAYVGDHLTDGWKFRGSAMDTRDDTEGAVAFVPGESGVFVKVARWR
jgi:hypothetical protein